MATHISASYIYKCIFTEYIYTQTEKLPAGVDQDSCRFVTAEMSHNATETGGDRPHLCVVLQSEDRDRQLGQYGQ